MLCCCSHCSVRHDRLHRLMQRRREDAAVVRVREVDERQDHRPAERVDLPLVFPHVVVGAERFGMRIDQNVLRIALDHAVENGLQRGYAG